MALPWGCQGRPSGPGSPQWSRHGRQDLGEGADGGPAEVTRSSGREQTLAGPCTQSVGGGGGHGPTGQMHADLAECQEGHTAPATRRLPS